MKKWVLFVIIICSYLPAQSQIDTIPIIDSHPVIIGKVWGLQLGMNKAEANVIIQKKVTPREFLREKNRDRYVFKNVTFAGINYNYALLSFYKNKFYSIYFTKKFNSDELQSCLSTYTDIKYSLIDKYGPPLQVDSVNTDNLVWTDQKNLRKIALFSEDSKDADVVVFTVSLLYLDEKINNLMEKQKKSDY